jgi:hypothetical protein
MIWALCIPVILFFTFSDLATWREFQRPLSFLNWAFFIFMGCFISFLISIVPIVIGCIIGSQTQKRYKAVLDAEYPLIALREKDGITGHSYFLGSGTIEDTQYYFWYRKQGDSIRGGKTKRTEGVRIFETDDSEPKMVTWKTEYSLDKWAWIIGFEDEQGSINWNPDFYIPKGSIKEGFIL